MTVCDCKVDLLKYGVKFSPLSLFDNIDSDIYKMKYINKQLKVNDKMQVFDIIDDLFQATGDGITVTAGILAVEHIKNHHLVVIFQEVSLHHSQLIQVSHQSQISLAHVIVSSFEIIKSL